MTTAITRARSSLDRQDSVLALAVWQEELRWKKSFWPQTTDFTCGPCCLLIAARLLGVGRPFRKVDEYLIWRRANTLFMGDNHTGCSPEGLGLAALQLGLTATIFQHESLPLLQGECQAIEHRRIMGSIVDTDRSHFLREGGKMHFELPCEEELQQQATYGNVPLCLVNEPDHDGRSALHWVVVAGFGSGSVAVLNPWARDVAMRLERLAAREFFERIRHGPEGRGAVLSVGRTEKPTVNAELPGQLLFDF